MSKIKKYRYILKYCERCNRVYYTGKMYCECGGRLRAMEVKMMGFEEVEE